MSWLDDWKKSTQGTDSGKPTKSACPECQGEALIWKVKKKGKNQGRPIMFCCDKEHCKGWKWMDLPKCDFCGEEKYEGMVRGGPNKGRFYQSCPHKCEGSFRWKK